MSFFKWHPLYECKHVPQRTEAQNKLDLAVRLYKAEGKKVKIQKDKKRMKFCCPYVDPVNGKQCTQTYATYKYIGAIKHLRVCSLRSAPGNDQRLQDYLKSKRISLST